MTRRCPNCGSKVPPESLNCPKCYTDIPRMPEQSHNENGNQYPGHAYENRKNKSHTLSLILATLPALIGLLGLAQIYQDYKNPAGWRMLVLEFATYIILITLVLGIVVFGIFGIVLIIPALLVGLFYLFLAFVNFMSSYSVSFVNKNFGMH